MKFQNISQEALDTAIRTALVAVAWPRFIAAYKGGNAKPNVNGEYSMPIGHYSGLQPEDHVLNITVNLTGGVFELEGGMHVGPGDRLCDLLVSAVQHQRKVTDITSAVTFDAVKELASSPEKRFNVIATVTLSITSRVPSAEDLRQKREKLVAQLAGLETSYPQSVANENRSYEEGKLRLEQDHSNRLAQFKSNYETRKTELEAEIARIDEQLK